MEAIKIDGKEYEIRTFEEVVTALKPKEVLIVRAGQVPSNIAYCHYSEPLEKCKSFLKKKGIRFGEFMEEELDDYEETTGDRFRYLRSGIRASADLGLLVHASPYPCHEPQCRDDNGWTIEKMAQIFPQDKLYLADPLDEMNEDFVLSCLSKTYQKKVRLEKRMVTL